MILEREAPAQSGSPSSSTSSNFSSSTLASRRNSFTISEKPPDGLSSFSSFSSFSKLQGLASSRVTMLPMPVVTSAATSAWDIAKSYIQKIPTQRITVPSYAPLSGFVPSASMLPPRLRTLFGNCLYRRVVLWIAGFLSLVLMVLLIGHSTHSSRLGFGGLGENEASEPSPESVWLNYTRLDSYYNGVRSIVSMDKYRPEFPTPEDLHLGQLGELSYAPKATEDATAPVNEAREKREEPASDKTDKKEKPKMPTPTRYSPQPDYNSSAYRSRYYPVQQCYLDADSKVPAPQLWAYNGLPQGHPDALIGSHSLLGIRDDVCFDRFGRYGPYGLGYSKEEGGTGQGFDTEAEGNEVVWSKGGKIDYNTMDWGAAQKRCYEANKDRFVAADKNFGATEVSALEGELKSEKRDTTVSNATESSGLEKLERMAIVVRCYADFKWTPHAVLNFRALVNEMALQSAGEYDVHILLHVRDESIPVWADRQTAEEFIAANVPAEFRSLVSLWAEGQMRLLYPGLNGQPCFDNPSNGDIHAVYRSAHLPMQHFAQQHPEYAHYWNWEMDMRFLGSYYEFFDRLGRWSDAQPRRRIWDRAAKYYIPALHGSWENFTAQVDAEAHAAGRPSVLGQMFFGGRTTTRDEDNGISPLPQGCEGASLSEFNRTKPDNVTEGPGRHFFADLNNNYTNIPEECGVNEPADLITLNPLFDSEDSGWVFANDITGYDLAFERPPRRTAIITASRLSRRLLFAMHEETWRLNHAMFAEMFPPSVALHRGFKATYAPHPVFTDRRWPLAAAERAFNAGPDHSSGASRQSPFDPGNEHFHRGMTWYYNSDFAGRLWRRWLGFLQPINDPRQPKPSSNSTEDNFLGGLAGGKGEEEREDGTGRMCLRSMLVHPIKFESLEEIFI